jgi:hypothetical protein
MKTPRGAGLEHARGACSTHLHPSRKERMRGNCSAGTLGSQAVPGTRSIYVTSPRTSTRCPPSRLGLPAVGETCAATRAATSHEVLPDRQFGHGSPDFHGILLQVLGQTVSAVDLSLLVPEPLSHLAFHQAVDHSVSRLLTGTHPSVKSMHLNTAMKDSVPLHRLVAIISVILLLALVEMGWR